jgi:predicted esterase
MWSRKHTDLTIVSAGAVVALQVAMKAKEPFAACVSLAGAIFEPDKVKKPINNTPIILQHNKGDFCFDWYERYLPMKDALKKNGYDVTVLERPNGSHTLYIDDAVSVSKLIATSLGYPKWYAENIKVK